MDKKNLIIKLFKSLRGEKYHKFEGACLTHNQTNQELIQRFISLLCTFFY
jgi:hypothetical protein